MLYFFQKVIALLFAVISICFIVLSGIKTLEYTVKKETSDKIKGAKISAIYFGVSAIAFFLAVEIYKPNLICIPFLLFFILLSWFSYTIYKKTNEFLDK